MHKTKPLMANKATIRKEMQSYCELNGIEDVDEFIWQCTVQGFSIVKYGTSPSDNVRREEEKPKKKAGRPRKAAASPEPSAKETEPEVKVTKRKIKIINND